MSNGPALLFDKSTVQRLNREEAYWLFHHFRGVVTPVFMEEVLGNLRKDFKGKSDSEKMVASLADKMGGLGVMPNASHFHIIEGEISGYPVEIRGVPLVAGGQRVVSTDGATGVFFDESPESKAFRAWSQGRFEEAEREQSLLWRTLLKAIDLEGFFRGFRLSKDARKKLTTLEEVAAFVDTNMDAAGTKYATWEAAMQLFVPNKLLAARALTSWNYMGFPSLKSATPYLQYVFRTTLIFYVAVGCGLITTRASNVVDLQYLYYLPFCMVFTSGDNLHRQLAPILMNKRQFFLSADDAQKAIRDMISYYNDLSSEVKSKGTASYGRYPPLPIETAVHAAYDATLPGWRDEAAKPSQKLTKEQEEAILKKLRPMMDAIRKISPGEPEND